MHPTLIVITGHPGSCKTTLAHQLSDHYKIPYVSKDKIKEHIFDILGSKDKEWSLKASAVGHRVMDDIITQELQAGHSVIVESNFKTELDSERFTALCRKHHADCIQILCEADGDTLFERWNARLSQGTRHEGHAEAISLEQIHQDLLKPYPPLSLPGRLIELDTSDAEKIELPTL